MGCQDGEADKSAAALRRTDVCTESATESATESSPIMPVRHGMLVQHLCKVMPVMQPRLGAQTFMPRGATKSW